MKKGLLVLLCCLFMVNSVYAKGLNIKQRKQELAKLGIELIYAQRRTGEEMDYLLCKDNCSDKNLEDRKKILIAVRKISKKYELYDDLSILKLHWYTWGSAFENSEYYNKLKVLEKRCECAMFKSHIGSNAYVKVDYSTSITKPNYSISDFALEYMNKPESCPLCQISEEEIKSLKEELL